MLITMYITLDIPIRGLGRFVSLEFAVPINQVINFSTILN